MLFVPARRVRTARVHRLPRAECVNAAAVITGAVAAILLVYLVANPSWEVPAYEVAAIVGGMAGGVLPGTVRVAARVARVGDPTVLYAPRPLWGPRSGSPSETGDSA